MNASRKSNASKTVEKKPATASGNIGNEIADAGNMDKIRDILFGNQARDYEKRFVKLEDQVAQDAADLKAEIVKRIDSLETYIKQEIKDINDRIKNESNDRSDADKSIQQDMKDSFEKVNKNCWRKKKTWPRKPPICASKSWNSPKHCQKKSEQNTNRLPVTLEKPQKNWTMPKSTAPTCRDFSLKSQCGSQGMMPET